MFYVTCRSHHLSYKSLKSYLAGIQFKAIMIGTPTKMCDMCQLYYLLRGIRRTQGQSRRRLPRIPITTTDLETLHLFISTLTIPLQDRKLYWAVVTLAFFGLLRSSEYTAPSINLLTTDVMFSPTFSYTTVSIKSSKTDPFRVGSIVRVVGSTNNMLCPVAAMQNFLDSSTHSGFLFTFQDGSYLTRSRLASLLTGSMLWQPSY